MKKKTLALNKKLDLISKELGGPSSEFFPLETIAAFCQWSLTTDEEWEDYIFELEQEAQTGIGWPEMGIAERKMMLQLTPEQKINAFGRAKRLWE